MKTVSVKLQCDCIGSPMAATNGEPIALAQDKEFDRLGQIEIQDHYKQ
jgi:hypothetical protein